MSGNQPSRGPEGRKLTTDDLNQFFDLLGVPEDQRPALIAAQVPSQFVRRRLHTTGQLLRSVNPSEAPVDNLPQVDAGKRIRNVLLLAGIAIGAAMLINVPNFWRDKPARPTELISLAAKDQAEARAQALANLDILKFTATCAVELQAKGAMLDKQRELGAFRPDEPDSSAYDQAAELARTHNIPCGPGETRDNSHLVMEINGARVSIVITGDTLVDPLQNVPTVCHNLPGLDARIIGSRPGSKQEVALTALAIQAHSYCRPPGSTPGS